jgi:hypothetical protein
MLFAYDVTPIFLHKIYALEFGNPQEVLELASWSNKKPS